MKEKKSLEAMLEELADIKYEAVKAAYKYVNECGGEVEIEHIQIRDKDINVEFKIDDLTPGNVFLTIYEPSTGEHKGTTLFDIDTDKALYLALELKKFVEK